MSTVTTDQLASALVTALAQDFGAGSDAGLNFSGTGAVLRGSYHAPPAGRLPFACVSGVALSGSRSQGMSLREWGYTHSWVIRAWVPATAVDLDARVERSEAALQALAGALATAANTAGNALNGVPDLAWEAIAVDSELDGGPHVCQVSAVVSCRTSRTGAP